MPDTSTYRTASGTNRIQIPIHMQNCDYISAMQFDLYLPEDISVAKDEDGEYLIDLAGRTTLKKHIVTEAMQSDGAMRIVVYSSSNKVITGNEGAILTLTLKADADIALGSYTVKVANVVMSELENNVVTEIKPDEKTSILTIAAKYEITSSGKTTGGNVTGAGTYSSDQDVTLTAIPETGYHFVSWSNGSTANPLVFKPTKSEEINATFAPNRYAVKYDIDGTIVHTDSVNYGDKITAWTAPTKEGYTFSGWSEILSTMPAEDITFKGTFNVNYYNITYVVDGEVYKVVSVAYGTTITLIPAPVKEGYKFSGWDTAPTTMPANNIEVSGSFIATGIANIECNEYVDVYNVDGRIAKEHILFSELNKTLTSGIYIVDGKKLIIKH